MTQESMATTTHVPLNIVQTLDELIMNLRMMGFQVEEEMRPIGRIQAKLTSNGNGNPKALVSVGFTNEFRVVGQVDPYDDHSTSLKLTVTGESESGVWLQSTASLLDGILRHLALGVLVTQENLIKEETESTEPDSANVTQAIDPDSPF